MIPLPFWSGEPLCGSRRDKLCRCNLTPLLGPDWPMHRRWTTRTRGLRHRAGRRWKEGSWIGRMRHWLRRCTVRLCKRFLWERRTFEVTDPTHEKKKKTSDCFVNTINSDILFWFTDFAYTSMEVGILYLDTRFFETTYPKSYVFGPVFCVY